MPSPGREEPVTVTGQDPADSRGDDVPARFAYAVGRLNRLLRPTRPTLSHGTMLALSTIVRCGPLRPTELGRIEGVSAPSATRLVIDLEKRGLVVRTPHPDDRRSFFVEATSAGLEAVLAAREERAAHAADLLAELTENECATIVNALSAIEKAASSGSPSPKPDAGRPDVDPSKS